MGERKSITYPDGNKAIYEYDEMLRLQKMRIRRSGGLAGISRTSDGFEEIRYKYDEAGRISEKLFPEGCVPDGSTMKEENLPSLSMKIGMVFLTGTSMSMIPWAIRPPSLRTEEGSGRKTDDWRGSCFQFKMFKKAINKYPK